jgi:hypothetical protein
MYNNVMKIYQITTRIINKYGETESEFTHKALSFPAAAKMAHRWFSGAGIDKPTIIRKPSEDYRIWEWKV